MSYRSGVRVGLSLLAILFPVAAGATVSLQKKAVELGFAANDCSYCHTFDREHMQKRARQLGLTSMNCGTCHGNKLPKTGRDLFSDRGKWLLDEKTHRGAKEADVSWLRNYVDKGAKSAR